MGAPQLVCGRDARFRAPPAQIPASGFPALGSCLGSKGKTLCCLPYAVPRTGHALLPVLRPGRVLRARISLGPPPSLHPLRGRSQAFVRSLRRSLAVSGVSSFVPVWVCHRSFLQLPRPLFGNFVGTTGQSDSLRPYIGGLRPQASHRGPRRHRRGRSQGLPVLAHGASTHARGLVSTAPGLASPRD